jgi:hypothetical protein
MICFWRSCGVLLQLAACSLQPAEVENQLGGLSAERSGGALNGKPKISAAPSPSAALVADSSRSVPFLQQRSSALPRERVLTVRNATEAHGTPSCRAPPPRKVSTISSHAAAQAKRRKARGSILQRRPRREQPPKTPVSTGCWPSTDQTQFVA